MYKQLMLSGILFSVWCVKASSGSETTITVISSSAYVPTNPLFARLRWADMLGKNIDQCGKLQISLLKTSYQVKAHELNVKVFEESTSKDDYQRRFDEEHDQLTRDTIACKDDINAQIEALRQKLENASSVSDFESLDVTIRQYRRPLKADLYALNLLLAIPQRPSETVQVQKDFKFKPILFKSAVK